MACPFKIEIILEKITTNPPIIKTVEMLLIILFPKTSPKLEKVTFLFLLKLDFEFLSILKVDLLNFQNLKIIPTVIQAKICVTSNNKPIVELPNILIPTVPTINNGPELLVKLSNLSHSSLEQILFSLKSQAILAPTG